MAKEKKMYPHERYSEEWERYANKLARSFAPDVRSCKDCGAPVIKGYCCDHCGSVYP